MGMIYDTAYIEPDWVSIVETVADELMQGAHYKNGMRPNDYDNGTAKTDERDYSDNLIGDTDFLCEPENVDMLVDVLNGGDVTKFREAFYRNAVKVACYLVNGADYEDYWDWIDER